MKPESWKQASPRDQFVALWGALEGWAIFLLDEEDAAISGEVIWRQLERAIGSCALMAPYFPLKWGDLQKHKVKWGQESPQHEFLAIISQLQAVLDNFNEEFIGVKRLRDQILTFGEYLKPLGELYLPTEWQWRRYEI